MKIFVKGMFSVTKDNGPVNDTVASAVLYGLDAEDLHIILPVFFLAQSLGYMPVEFFSLSQNSCFIITLQSDMST